MKKILIADDNALTRNLIANILTENNYHVICAIDGEDCILKADTEAPDLILLDIIMPKLYGGGVLIKLRETKSNSDNTGTVPMIPVIVITGSNLSQIKKWFEKRKIQGYLQKPFDFDELLNKISDCLENTENA